MPSAGPAETRALAAAVDAALDARARAEARLRDVVADTAHELRTPLTSVHGWAELYQQGALDEAGVDHAMDRIEAAATRMRHLVDQVALLARLDAEVPLERAPVELGAVVDEVLVDLDVIAPGRPVTWERPDTAVTVHGDRARLVQVVENLVANVVRHTPADAALTVTLARARRPGPDGGHAAVLTVRDDGPGVPPELAPRVFERFARQTRPAGAPASGPREGSGLGLAIVAAVVAAHGGSVDLRSSPGEGTTVTVELPATAG
jgi:two-component system OmpR family sensor kinase